MKGFHISTYAIMFLSSFVISFIVVFWLLRKKGVAANKIGYSLLLNILLILYGAKMYEVIISGFQVSIFQSGIASIGGVLGLLLGIFIMGFICKEERKYFWECYVAVIPLLYGISKLGCYSAGCCHGIIYNGPLAIRYDNEVVSGGPYFPVQLLESVVFVIIFAICLVLYIKKNNPFHICLVLILCSLAKFSIEYLREEHIGVVLSPNQIVCILIVVICGMISLILGKKSRKTKVS